MRDHYQTKKDAALELFANGATLEEVMEILDMEKNMAYKYRAIVKREERKRRVAGDGGLVSVLRRHDAIGD